MTALRGSIRKGAYQKRIKRLRQLSESFLLVFLLLCSIIVVGEETPIDTVKSWMDSCSKLDIEGMVSTYSNEASSFLTTHRELVMGKKGIKDYLAKSTSKMEPSSMNCQFTPYAKTFISDRHAVIAGWDKITGTINKEPFINEGRLSFILTKDNDGWKIIHFHRSGLPQVKQ